MYAVATSRQPTPDFDGADDTPNDFDATARFLAEAEAAERAADAAGLDPDRIIAKLEAGWELPTLDVSSELNADYVSRDRLADGDSAFIDDWDEAQVPVVQQMVSMCRAVVAIATSERRRRQLVQWAFGHDQVTDRINTQAGRDTFAACCHQLSVRPYVIRAMLHHQWFRHAITFTKPLPASADPLPEGLLGEGYLRDFSCGGDALAAAWHFPSQPLPDFLADVAERAKVTKKQADDAFTQLVLAGLLGTREGRVWFTGRSPDYLARRRTSFARSFIEPEVSREEGDDLRDMLGDQP